MCPDNSLAGPDEISWRIDPQLVSYWEQQK